MFIISDSTSNSWDAVKAVVNGSGFQVLLEGDAAYTGQYLLWDVNASGRITNGSGWKTTAQAVELGWESTFGDLNGDEIIGSPIVDANGDGFVDGISDYQIFNDGSPTTLTGSRGDIISDSTSNSWDAVKAVVNGSGFQVLLEGDATYTGQYLLWDVNASGRITNGSGWKTTAQAVELGWESTFGDLNGDEIIGSPIVDANGDGFVDGISDYQIFNDGSPTTLTGSRGDIISDSTSNSWDAVKAVVNGSGFQVLLEGDAAYTGQYLLWDVNASGRITNGSGWKTTAQAVELGWESTFGDLNGDEIIGVDPLA